MSHTLNTLTPILSRWVTTRDNMVKRHDNGDHVKQREFINALEGHAERVGAELPDMNLAELEALTELCGTLLNLKRMKISQAMQAFRIAQ